MNIRRQRKKKLALLPREDNYSTPRPRKKALYYRDYCCKQCYFDWGRWFAKHHMYLHDCAESNYQGLLKKYWKDAKDSRELTPAFG